MTPLPYAAPLQGCTYEEEPVCYELFYAATMPDLRNPQLSHLMGHDGLEYLDEGQVTAPGPLVVEIPQKLSHQGRLGPLPRADSNPARCSGTLLYSGRAMLLGTPGSTFARQHVLGGDPTHAPYKD